MGFMLKMNGDDGYRWIQCRYERVFRCCYSCGRIGHKAEKCIWTNEQVRSSIQGQLIRAREIFDLNIGMELLKNHFVAETRAFANHASRRRTTRIELISERD